MSNGEPSSSELESTSEDLVGDILNQSPSSEQSVEPPNERRGELESVEYSQDGTFKIESPQSEISSIENPIKFISQAEINYATSLGLRPEMLANLGLGNLDQSVINDKTLLHEIFITASYLSKAFPGRQISIFSAEGSSAILFQDSNKPEEVFKVAKDRDGSGYFDEEARKMKLLGDRGLAPKLIAYCPRVKTPHEKMIEKLLGKTSSTDGFSRTELPLGPESEVPIIVMQKVLFDKFGLEALNEEELRVEATRIAAELSSLGIGLGDNEFVLEKNTRKLLIIDVGGARLFTQPTVVTPEDIIKYVNDDIRINRAQDREGKNR